MTNNPKHIAVLLGGLSSEREVSLNSGAACAEALEGEGYKVTRIDVGHDIAQRLIETAPDVCFNALHGKWGEDGCIQGLLETLRIPYTHSGVLASSVAMHKERAKLVMHKAGVPVAESRLVLRSEVVQGDVMEPPYVVKPVDDGSSVGIFIIRDEGSNLLSKIESSGQPDDELMVERYVPGRELTCAVMGSEALDVIEILPSEGLDFYDFEAKYTPGGSKHILPAKISPNIYQLIQTLTVRAHVSLGCRGISRADFRLDEKADGSYDLACLEVNTQPGMTATSLVPELAAYRGMSFGDLVRWIVEDASCDR
ncbi:MAG: D-alanine--D-alanine ligase [Methyloligellaceae bacterium]